MPSTGKTLRGSLGRFADVAPLQWLSAFATEQRLGLGQISLADGDKNSEITAAQRLIEELGLSGMHFTLDALHTQKSCRQPSKAVTTASCRSKSTSPRCCKAAQHWPSSNRVPTHTETPSLGQRNRIETRCTAVWPVAGGRWAIGRGLVCDQLYRPGGAGHVRWPPWNCRPHAFIRAVAPETESPSKRKGGAKVRRSRAQVARALAVVTVASATGGILFNLTTNGNAQLLVERFRNVVSDPATPGCCWPAPTPRPHSLKWWWAD